MLQAKPQCNVTSKNSMYCWKHKLNVMLQAETQCNVTSKNSM